MWRNGYTINTKLLSLLLLFHRGLLSDNQSRCQWWIFHQQSFQIEGFGDVCLFCWMIIEENLLHLVGLPRWRTLHFSVLNGSSHFPDHWERLLMLLRKAFSGLLVFIDHLTSFWILNIRFLIGLDEQNIPRISKWVRALGQSESR